MKPIFTLSLIIFILFSSNAQYFSMKNVVNRPCQFDSTQTMLQLSNWDLYQTENDHWDGTKLEQCYRVTKNGTNIFLDLSSIDKDKAIFISAQLDSFNVETLEANKIYIVESIYSGDDQRHYDLERQCNQDVCSGLILGIKIPTEDGLRDTLRFHKLQFDTGLNLHTCLPTEYFAGQEIDLIVYKLKLKNEDDSDLIQISPMSSNIYNFGLGELDTFNSLTVPESSYNGNEYVANIAQCTSSPFANFFLGLHDPTLYPRSGNETGIEAKLEINRSDVQNIRIFVQYYQTLFFQAYTKLIGELIEGSNEIRHNVILELDGGNVCLGGADFNFEGGTTMNYKEGDIGLSSQSSCIKFQAESKLVIDHSTLNYGEDNGAGMLALMTGSELRMKGKSNLFINNTLAVLATDEIPGQSVDIYLKKGQNLVFNKTAHVISFGEVIIKLHMQGGTADLSNLTSHERSKFQFIYDSPTLDAGMKLDIFPNPFSSEFTCSFNVKEEQEVSWKISDLSGKEIAHGYEQTNPGMNHIAIHPAKIKSGFYFLQLTTTEGSQTRSVQVISY